jgi:hypothetical protein
MERRLAEATNAARARRTRGEIGLRRFFAAVLLEAPFCVLVFEDVAFFWAGLAGGAFWADFDDFAGDVPADLSEAAEDDVD